MISVAIFYALATLVAVGLSYKKGGPIAIAATLIAVMWFFQIALYFVVSFEVGDLIGPMINGSLILCIVFLPGARFKAWAMVVVASLLCQLSVYSTDAITGAHSDLAINVLYILQLLALGWSGGKLVLDDLVSWLASVWSRRAVLAVLGGQAGILDGTGNRSADDGGACTRPFSAANTFRSRALQPAYRRTKHDR